MQHEKTAIISFYLFVNYCLSFHCSCSFPATMAHVAMGCWVCTLYIYGHVMVFYII